MGKVVATDGNFHKASGTSYQPMKRSMKKNIPGAKQISKAAAQYVTVFMGEYIYQILEDAIAVGAGKVARKSINGVDPVPFQLNAATVEEQIAVCEMRNFIRPLKILPSFGETFRNVNRDLDFKKKAIIAAEKQME